MVDAPRLARRLGVARCWIKNDAVSHPSLSFKDRVVTAAINAAHAFGLVTIGCASTGNLANAVAAHDARAGLPAWIFMPHDLELGKVVGRRSITRFNRPRGTRRRASAAPTGGAPALIASPPAPPGIVAVLVGTGDAR